MTRTLHFAHVTDIHISDRGDTAHVVGTYAPELARECFERLNGIDDLDFVLISGDVLDLATQAELDRFLDVLAVLRKTWHFIPGNHDGFIHEKYPDAFQPHEAIPLIDPRLASPRPDAQKARWSRTVAAGIQMIGLDSRIPDTWAGEVGAEQLEWLKAELEAHRDDLVIVAIHHPIHKLAPHLNSRWWQNYLCRNHRELNELFDCYPNVGLVLAGHHHANQIRLFNGRVHINTAALSGYPCSYRTLRLSETEGGWRLQVETHQAGHEAIWQRAREVAIASHPAYEYDPQNPTTYLEFCAGQAEDLSFDGLVVQ
jgi:Icc protein